MKNHAAIVLHDGDKILFIKRAATKKSLPNIWAFPSGTMEDGETIKETAIREAREELGVDVIIEREIGSVELPELESILHFVICKKSYGDIIFNEGEIQKIRWMTFDEFFNEYSDDQIGHGLIYLRKNPQIWQSI
ncbi:MAG: NUDIX hydrolase [Candidatus Colwellbacteria bacterium]|nr:NUDIX hydrolase [Candidatus Colwellbacteria bacterium]